MFAEYIFKIYAVQLVAGQHHDVFRIAFKEVTKPLTNGIRSALKPLFRTGCLLGGQDAYGALREGIEAIGSLDVPVERLAVELRQNVDVPNAAVDAVADGYVDQTVFPRDRNRRLGPLRGQRHETAALAAPQNHTNCAHRHTS